MKPTNSQVSLSQLLTVDLKAFLSWWKTHTVSKVIVSLLFALVFGLVALLIYAGGLTFLRPLTGFGDYGRLTATYLFQASILVTVWLGVGSSFISTYEYLTAASSETDLLVTYPVRPGTIVGKLLIRSIATSLLWSLIVFLPLGLVVVELFGQGINMVSILNLVVIIAVVISFCTAVGGWLAFVIADIKRLRSVWLTFVLAGVYIIATLFLIRFLLPPQLAELENPSDNFNEVFALLPINKYPLPTLALTRLLLGQWSPAAAFTIAGLIVLLGIVIVYQARGFLRIRRKLSSMGQGDDTHKPNQLLYGRYSLTVKDILGVIRSQREMGYGFFLIFLVLGFFYFLQARVLTSPVNQSNTIFRYSLSWFLFYSIAYLLRLVFPLMAREGKTVWFLFTKSVTYRWVMVQKNLAALLLALPLFVIAVSIWPNLIGLQVIGVIVVFTILAASMGSLWPNFEAGDDPDRVSTSAMGLMTLIVMGFISYMVVSFWL